MNSSSTTADLSLRFNKWLERFSPPRQIASNREAMQADANSLLRIILDHAPAEGWQDWYSDMIRKLEAGMTTRSWPAPGELVRACRGAERPRFNGHEDANVEAAAVDAMIGWYQRFGNQMPRMGKPSRTRKLIERGILRDLGEARFRGFDLSEGDMRVLVDVRKNGMMPPCMDEQQRHAAVSERIRAFARKSPLPPGPPDLRANRVTDALKGADE